VTVEDRASGGSSSKSYEISDDRGLRKMYVIELPAASMSTIRIAPLGTNGQFALERILLSNKTANYSWDELGHCSRQTLQQGGMTREPCSGPAPELTTAEDGTVVISSIPAEESARSAQGRIANALLMSIGVFLGGVWLFRPDNGSFPKISVQSYAVRISWLAVAALCAYQLYLISRYAVDLPFEDEWDYFKASSLSQELSWRWLFGFHNEHRIVLTKLMAWLNLKMVGLDFYLQKIFNFFIFGGLLIALTGFKNRVAGRENFGLFPLFLVFLLSPIAFENHLWAFQSQFHLVLLFSVAALHHCYPKKLTCMSACIFSLYMLLAMYTFSAGVVLAIIYLLCLSVYLISGISGRRIDRLSGGRFLLIAGTVLTIGILLWFYGYEKPAWPPPKLYPSDLRFWEYYLNIVSFGFGFNSIHIIPGVVCLLIAICPLMLLLAKQETRWQPSTWQILAAILGVLAVLASISVGRGEFGEPKTSRYVEIGFMLIPYAALAWWLVVQSGSFPKYILCFLWLVCCMAYFNDWSTHGYAERKQIERYNFECVEGYYNGIGNGVCQGRTAPADLDRAIDMGAKFARQFSARGYGGH
jgi:hypothetical protein